MPVSKHQNFRAAPVGGSLNGFGAVAVLLASATCAVPALAQTAGGAAAGQGRQIRVMALARVQYDDNVVLNNPSLAAGQPKGDVSTAPSLDVNVFLPRATGDFYLRGNVGYNFYRRYTRLNRESIDLTGGGNQRLASCIGHAEIGYSRRLSDLGNLLAQDVAASVNNTEERRNYTADIGCGGQIGLRPSIGVSRSEVRNSTTLRKFADSNTNSVTGQLGLASPAIGTVSIFGRYSDSSYINRATPNGVGQDGLKSYAAGVQLERTVGTRLDFRGSVNYTKVDPKLAGTPGFSGMGFDLATTYRGDLFNIVIGASRSAVPSQLLFVSYNLETTARATVTRRLSERTQLQFGASFLRREFASSPLFPDAPPSGKDENLTFNAGLRYEASRRLRFSLDGTYMKRTSNIQLFGFDAKRISLTTSLSL